MSDDVAVIAIDGPGGSGKGTVARRVAAQLGWNFLDSGALYRLVALAALRHGVDLDDTAALANLAGRLQARFATAAGDERIWLEGEEVSLAIRSEECGAGASQLAGHGAVRQALLQRQRGFRQPPGLVADGRDMGSVVFPGARLKVFLTASPEERARRRYNQLKDKGIDVSLPALSEDIAERDRRDTERSVAPLKPAADARVLDSTGLAVEQVVAQVLEWAAGAGMVASASEGED